MAVNARDLPQWELRLALLRMGIINSFTQPPRYKTALARLNRKIVGDDNCRVISILKKCWSRYVDRQTRRRTGVDPLRIPGAMSRCRTLLQLQRDRQMAKFQQAASNALPASWCKHRDCCRADSWLEARLSYVTHRKEHTPYQRRHGYGAGTYDVLTLYTPDTAMPNVTAVQNGVYEVSIGPWTYSKPTNRHELCVRFFGTLAEAIQHFPQEGCKDRRAAMLSRHGRALIDGIFDRERQLRKAAELQAAECPAYLHHRPGDRRVEIAYD